MFIPHNISKKHKGSGESSMFQNLARRDGNFLGITLDSNDINYY